MGMGRSGRFVSFNHKRGGAKRHNQTCMASGTNTAAADDVFSKLDTNGDGSVSLDELSSALKGAGSKGGHHGHHHAASSSTSGASSSDPLLQALQAGSSTSASGTATQSYNAMIQQQLQTMSLSA